MSRYCHITDHAVDQASIRLWRLWRKERRGTTLGLMTWLQGRTDEAVRRLPKRFLGECKVVLDGVCFTFQADRESLRLIAGLACIYLALCIWFPPARELFS